MLKKIAVYFLLVLMLLNGLLFVSNIYVLNNLEAALLMHEDLAPSASLFIANAKVLICFLTGLLYVISSIGLFLKHELFGILAFIAFMIFDAFYLYEFFIFLPDYPMVLIGFLIFGTLSALFGIYGISVAIAHVKRNKMNND